MTPKYLTSAQGRKLAYDYIEGEKPGVVFLGGFVSDMTGTKASFLRDWAIENGRAFLRFDYSGHGSSAGVFAEGCLGEWIEDAIAVINAVTSGPQILVGSSMGGWIGLKLLRDASVDIAGLVTIAAAPDFTEDGFWASFSDEQRSKILSDGKIELPSDYGQPYVITQKLIEDGRSHLLLRDPLALEKPVRMLQGTQDAEVSVETANRILSHASGADIHLTTVKRADHSFSTPECLQLVLREIDALTVLK
ncbi:MAG: alpha/beta hydrolase [Mangrovicoccus sp.]